MCPARLLDFFDGHCIMGLFIVGYDLRRYFEQVTQNEMGRVLLFAVHTACSHLSKQNADIDSR